MPRPPPGAKSPTPSGSPPSFGDVEGFVEAYRFRSRWPTEAHYEAELYGALTARYGEEYVQRQERRTSGIPDITVKASVEPSGSIPTYIEMKVPLNPGQVRGIEEQVRRYVEGGITNLIVVLIGYELQSVAPLDDLVPRLQSLGARVARKSR